VYRLGRSSRCPPHSARRFILTLYPRPICGVRLRPQWDWQVLLSPPFLETADPVSPGFLCRLKPPLPRLSHRKNMLLGHCGWRPALTPGDHSSGDRNSILLDSRRPGLAYAGSQRRALGEPGCAGAARAGIVGASHAGRRPTDLLHDRHLCSARHITMDESSNDTLRYAQRIVPMRPCAFR
jgi:hypothetical protein